MVESQAPSIKRLPNCNQAEGNLRTLIPLILIIQIPISRRAMSGKTPSALSRDQSDRWHSEAHSEGLGSILGKRKSERSPSIDAKRQCTSHPPNGYQQWSENDASKSQSSFSSSQDEEHECIEDARRPEVSKGWFHLHHNVPDAK
jgi:hypothetical protein